MPVAEKEGRATRVTIPFLADDGSEHGTAGRVTWMDE